VIASGAMDFIAAERHAMPDQILGRVIEQLPWHR